MKKELNSREYFKIEFSNELHTSLAMAFYTNAPNEGFAFGYNLDNEKQIGMNITGKGNGWANFNISMDHLKFIYDGLYIMLSDNELFKGIGESDKIMKVSTFDFISDGKSFNDFRFDYEENGKARFDEIRIELHSYLFGVAIKLVAFHETIHYFNGHLGLLANEGLESLQDGIEKGIFTELDSQTMEMDADSIAANALVRFLTTMYKEELIPEELRGYEGSVKSVCFASFLLFYILPIPKNSQFETWNSLLSKLHPPAQFRHHFISGAILQRYIESGEEETWKKLAEIDIEIIVKCKETIKKVTDNELDMRGYKEIFSDEGFDYIKKLSMNWNYLRPRLEPFAKKRLAPYTTEFMNKIFSTEYNNLLLELEFTKYSFLCLTIENDRLIKSLKEKKPRPINILKSFSESADTYNFDFNDFIKRHEELSIEFEFDYNSACDKTMATNNTFLIKQTISQTFELVYKYIAENKIKSILYNLDWFQVLFALNNSIFNKQADFPNEFPATVCWRKISITHGQLKPGVYFQYIHVIELIDHVHEYFSENLEMLKNDEIADTK